MTFHVLSLILAGILSFADYITENIFSKKLRKNQKLISFAAGVAVSYIILSLLPEISSYSLIDGKKLFLFVLFGFASLNLIEQYMYREIGKLTSSFRYHRIIHIIYYFIYNFFIGLVLVTFALKGMIQVLIFFVPFLLYIIVELLPQEFEFRNSTFKIFYSLAPLFGAIIGINSIEFIGSAFGELISFISGTLLYIVIRESLPSDEAEKPLYFIIGILSYTLIIYMSWNFA
ncbi:hypothetical protein HYV80_05190 [Candidatus Woesearchaeota archaeon]|nr:hypothetical protein [Candidatus Woesearchaeota archaeon]